MPKCELLKRRKRQICIGDMDIEIDISQRFLDDGFGGSETMIFTPVLSGAMAKVDTLQGVFVVDMVNGGDQEATHRITIYFPDIEISGELWVQFGGNNYRILNQQNYEERNEFLSLLCTVRGSNTKGAAHG